MTRKVDFQSLLFLNQYGKVEVFTFPISFWTITYVLYWDFDSNLNCGMDFFTHGKNTSKQHLCQNIRVEDNFAYVNESKNICID